MPHPPFHKINLGLINSKKHPNSEQLITYIQFNTFYESITHYELLLHLCELFANFFSGGAYLKFRYSEKTTNIWPIFHSFFWQPFAASNHKWKMRQIFVASSEYLNFTYLETPTWNTYSKLKKKQVHEVKDVPFENRFHSIACA